MKKFKKIALILVVILVLLQLFMLTQSVEKENNKPMVSVSSFSIYDITKHIAHDSVEIVNILPFGVDPHSFEPTPKLMAEIEQSALVLYSGAGLEPWIGTIAFKNRAIDMSKRVELRDLGDDEFEHHKHHDEQCAHNKLDPHYWLDFSNMKSSANIISEELIKILPQNRELYLQNRDKYIHMLEKLDASYKKHLSSCKIDTVILNHNSIGYLAKNYHFHSESLTGLSPEDHPTAKDIERIFEEIEHDGVNTIFYENFVSSRVIESLAKDAGVNVEVFQSLGNITADEAKAKVTYEEVMYLNLKKLSKAMECN